MLQALLPPTGSPAMETLLHHSLRHGSQTMVQSKAWHGLAASSDLLSQVCVLRGSIPASSSLKFACCTS